MSSEVTFVTVIEGGHLEFGTLRLVESLRKWGGRLADSPFLFVKPRPGPEPSRATRRRMNELGVDYLCTASRNRYDWYNFLNKPASVLRASDVAQTPFLCWLDADILVLNEPCQLVPGPDLDFVACAPSMDMHTVGPGSRYDAYWGEFCRAVGFSLEALGTVRVHREDMVTRTYFNSGVIGFRISSGYADAYYHTVLAALDARITSSTDGIFMHEQMSLTIAAKALGLRIRELPWTYNFSSYDLESTNPRARDAAAGMVVFHYHGYFFPEKFGRLCELIADRRPDRLDFVRSLGSYDVSRLGPWKRLRTRLRKEVRRRQEKRYVAACRTIETPSIL